MFLSGGRMLFPFLDISLAKSWQTWAGLASSGVRISYIAFYLYGQSLRMLSPVTAAVLGNVEPVTGTFFLAVLG